MHSHVCAAGAGAFEVAAAQHLRTVTKKTVEGLSKLGIEAFAEALLSFPKTLAENSGFDPQEVIIKLQVGERGELSSCVVVMWVGGWGGREVIIKLQVSERGAELICWRG